MASVSELSTLTHGLSENSIDLLPDFYTLFHWYSNREPPFCLFRGVSLLDHNPEPRTL